MNPTARPMRVAFQGERGAFSEEAAVKLLGESIETVPRMTFEALFSAIDEGAADFALAPIENSLAGSVHRSFDLLLESELTITAEVVLPIAHNLIAMPGASLQDITVVESHPVALAQCERFFQEHPRIQRIATHDTAGSVRQMMETGDHRRGAIAGKRAAKIYGGEILRGHIEDHRENYTRFLLLAKNPGPTNGADKLSLVVRLNHRPGALHGALRAFAQRNINLLKIESRPIPGRPWQYRFYLDLQTSLHDPQTAAALQELKECTDETRVLGCYPADRDFQTQTQGKEEGP